MKAKPVPQSDLRWKLTWTIWSRMGFFEPVTISDWAKPIVPVPKKDGWIWSFAMPSCQEAFKKSKELLTTSEVLTYGGQLFLMYFWMVRKCQLLLHQGHWTRQRLIMLNRKKSQHNSMTLSIAKKTLTAKRMVYPECQSLLQSQNRNDPELSAVMDIIINSILKPFLQRSLSCLSSLGVRCV